MPEEENQYAFRKDPMERDRLNLQHSIHRRGLGGNFKAPIGKTSDKLDMLDIGGGTGIWCREMARQFPNAQVETFDKDTFLLEQVAQRMKADMPSNCHHYPQSVDALKRWPYLDASFNYVHGRYLASFVPYARWPHIAAEAMRVCRPGGWVEFVEGPEVRCDAPAFQELMGAVLRIMRLVLGEGEVHEVVPESLQTAGAINVQLQPYLLGAGSTQNLQPDIAEDLARVFQSIGPRIMAAGVIEDWRYLDCMAHLKEDMLAAGITMPVYVVIGQKA